MAAQLVEQLLPQAFRLKVFSFKKVPSPTPQLCISRLLAPHLSLPRPGRCARGECSASVRPAVCSVR